MASFPTSIKTWTNLTDGSDYPQAAHLNEAYAEITAIETGYINGTAPLNSSNSTVANLSVTGGSTLAGVLTIGGLSVSSNSTIGGGLQVTGGSTLTTVTVSSNATVGGLIRVSSQTHCAVRSEVVQDLGNESWTGVSFDVEDLDVGAMHSTASNSSRVTVPTGSSGVYLLTASVRFGLQSSGICSIRLLKDDTTDLTNPPLSGNSIIGAGVNITAVANLDAAEYVTLQMYQNSGSTMSIGSTSDRLYQPQLSVVRMF